MEEKGSSGGKVGKDESCVMNPSFTPSRNNNDSRTLKISCFSIDRDTLALKLILFLYFGGMACIMPFFTVHMLTIGISIKETAIIYGVLPFTSFIGPPLIGFLADKLGQYKLVLIIVTIANALSHSLLLAVPSYAETAVSTNLELQWDSGLQSFYLSPDSTEHCEIFSTSQWKASAMNLTAAISACGESYNHSSKSALRRIQWNSTEAFANYDEPDLCKTNARMGLLQSICSQYDDVDFSEAADNNTKSTVLLHVGELQGCTARLISPEVYNWTSTRSFQCQTNITMATGEKIIIGNNAVTFWMYFVVRVIATVFMSACYTMLDAAVLAVGKRNPKTRFGVQRIFSVLGQATMSLIAGILVDWFSQGKAQKDYSAAFYASNFLFLLNVLAYCVAKLDVEKPGKNVFGDAAKLFKYPEVVAFLVMIFLLGNMWGFVKSYLFVFLKDELRAPTTLMGLTVTVSSIIAIPILFRADKIVDKIGRVNVIAMSFIVYFVRFIAYSYLTNAWWCLPFEAMEAFTYHLMWTAAATYCSILAPKGLLATLSGIMGTLHYRLGQGSGSFIGGYVIGLIQVRQSFWYFGIAAAVFGVVYFILNYAWIQKLVDKRNSKMAAKAREDTVEKGDAGGSAADETMKAMLPANDRATD